MFQRRAMNDNDTPVLDASFFKGRWLVEIEAWACTLALRLSSEDMPRQYRFQGGLDFVRGFDLEGRIRAPKAYGDVRIDIHVSPFGPEIDEWEDVGRLYFHPEGRAGKSPLTATLRIPEVSLPLAATCLNSIWKYLHIWTFDEDAEEASVSDFGFDSKIHKTLAAWVEGQ